MEISNVAVTASEISFIGRKAGQPAIRFLAQGECREHLARWLKTELGKPMFPRGGLRQTPEEVLFFAGTTEVMPAVKRAQAVATVAT
jgi:hypothetical protein